MSVPERFPLRVLFSVQRAADALGGTERQAGRLAEALRRRGHAVELVSGLGAGGAAGHAVRTASAVLRYRPHIVHVHLLSAHAVAACLAAPLAGARVVVKLGASREGDIALSRRTALGRAKLAFVLPRAAFLAPNEECRRELATLGVPDERIAVIPNGVDLSRFRPGPPDRAPVVLFAGRLAHQKGLDILRRAWPAVRAEVREARLVVAGDGPERAEVARWAEEDPSVSYHGAVADPRPLYAAARVFVLPSRYEGISNALLEAMASGCAPVATRVGGNDEVIEDGTSGLLVPPEDPEALAAAILRALASADALGRAARARAGDFAIERIAEEVEAFYWKVLAGGRRP